MHHLHFVHLKMSQELSPLNKLNQIKDTGSTVAYLMALQSPTAMQPPYDKTIQHRLLVI